MRWLLVSWKPHFPKWVIENSLRVISVLVWLFLLLLELQQAIWHATAAADAEGIGCDIEYRVGIGVGGVNHAVHGKVVNAIA